MSWHLHDIVGAFMEIKGNKSATTIHYVQNSRYFKPQLDKSALIFFPTEFLMFEFFKNPRLINISPVDFKFLLYIDEVPKDVPIISNYVNDITTPRSHLYFFLNDVNQVQFYTYDHFTSNSCNKPKIQFLNTFNKLNLKWIRPLKYHKKFKNFSNCPLLLSEVFGQYFHFEYRNSEMLSCAVHTDCLNYTKKLIETEKADGTFVEMFKMMSKKSNFMPIFSIVSGTDYKFAADFEVPMIKLFAGTILNSIHGDFFATGLSINSHYMFAVTPTEFYNNYEKLWLPFDDVTWTLLLLTFIVAFIVIFILNFVPKRLKLLFYGGTVHSPALNVIHIFFGISQMKLPDASIPRLILMLFITFCLIFRTCYQSELFEFMTSDMRKPPPNTVEDLIDRNYTIVACNKVQRKMLMDMKVLEKYRHKILIYGDCGLMYNLYCDNYDKVSSKLAFFFEDIQYSSLNSFCQGSAIKLKKFRNDVVLSSFLTYRNSFIYDILKEILEKIIPAGIPQYLVEYHMEQVYKKYEPIENNEPKVLTVDDLTFGFVVWLGSCGIAVLGFIYEILRFNVNKVVNGFAGLWMLSRFLDLGLRDVG
ncbi:uncharacterized protein [Chironomus tepperi]